ncbi:unnamed protein product [Acanthoscelides obtectus]|uniref:C2H2-type domain-containing protein n=1 Tax=Acanthoscelides obtectus TaxID=200917 RepID=A0A9P0QCM8_ACAOB|nr:unnamed protein product [Acanthoscelides obtectus]CAK1670304.1 hypothetical protein AOBTE_LOCUS27546 [Acanthoscelides obtectus]
MEIHSILDENEAVLDSNGRVCEFATNKLSKIPKGGLFCTQCNIKFSTKKTLNHHLKYKHNRTQLVYICPDCKDPFANAWCVYRHLLKVHRKTSQQIRRLRQQIHNSVVRKDHCPKKKKDNVTPADVEEPDEENQWITNVEDFQMCGGCGKRYERKAALQSHVTMCLKRMAVCNTIKENKKREEEAKGGKIKDKSVSPLGFKGASKRKPYQLRTYKPRPSVSEQGCDENANSGVAGAVCCEGDTERTAEKPTTTSVNEGIPNSTALHPLTNISNDAGLEEKDSRNAAETSALVDANDGNRDDAISTFSNCTIKNEVETQEWEEKTSQDTCIPCAVNTKAPSSTGSVGNTDKISKLEVNGNFRDINNVVMRIESRPNEIENATNRSPKQTTSREAPVEDARSASNIQNRDAPSDSTILATMLNNPNCMTKNKTITLISSESMSSDEEKYALPLESTVPEITHEFNKIGTASAIVTENRNKEFIRYDDVSEGSTATSGHKSVSNGDDGLVESSMMTTAEYHSNDIKEEDYPVPYTTNDSKDQENNSSIKDEDLNDSSLQLDESPGAVGSLPLMDNPSSRSNYRLVSWDNETVIGNNDVTTLFSNHVDCSQVETNNFSSNDRAKYYSNALAVENNGMHIFMLDQINSCGTLNSTPESSAKIKVRRIVDMLDNNAERKADRTDNCNLPEKLSLAVDPSNSASCLTIKSESSVISISSDSSGIENQSIRVRKRTTARKLSRDRLGRFSSDSQRVLQKHKSTKNNGKRTESPAAAECRKIDNEKNSDQAGGKYQEINSVSSKKNERPSVISNECIVNLQKMDETDRSIGGDSDGRGSSPELRGFSQEESDSLKSVNSFIQVVSRDCTEHGREPNTNNKQKFTKTSPKADKKESCRTSGSPRRSCETKKDKNKSPKTRNISNLIDDRCMEGESARKTLARKDTKREEMLSDEQRSKKERKMGSDQQQQGLKRKHSEVAAPYHGEQKQELHHADLSQKASSYMDVHLLQCKACQKTFPKLTMLMNHMSAHFSWFRFQCSSCTLVTYSKTDCIAHAVEQHGVSQEYLSSMVLPIPSWKTLLMSHDFRELEEHEDTTGKHTDEVIVGYNEEPVCIDDDEAVHSEPVKLELIPEPDIDVEFSYDTHQVELPTEIYSYEPYELLNKVDCGFSDRTVEVCGEDSTARYLTEFASDTSDFFGDLFDTPVIIPEPYLTEDTSPATGELKGEVIVVLSSLSSGTFFRV